MTKFSTIRNSTAFLFLAARLPTVMSSIIFCYNTWIVAKVLGFPVMVPFRRRGVAILLFGTLQTVDHVVEWSDIVSVSHEGRLSTFAR
jgi:hypothetical protein